MITTDVCIIGAGPGGVATALKLSYLGIPSVLVEKTSFPRDKVCGDAISGKVTTLLNRLDPQIMHRFKAIAIQTDIWGVRFVAPNQKVLDIPFKASKAKDAASAPGYVSKRMDFDHFLIQEVKRRDNIQYFDKQPIKHFEQTEGGYIVSNESKDFSVACKILIDSSGAHSSFSRKEVGLKKDPKHHAGAIRAYFRNVKGFSEHNFIELHYIKEVTPGYFWIFPLPNGEANVGLGMLTDIISKKKVNLKKAFADIIEKHPEIKERFKEAEQIGKIEGYGLPLGSKTRPISGAHYMLVGDAGHLIDPLTGEGIGNAFYSGFIAAEQARDCLKEQNFSAAFMKAYDVRVARVLGSEMKLSYKMQRIGQYPFLLNIVANIIYHNQKIITVISNMYTDFDLREQLVKPLFWLKLFFKR